MQTYQHMPMVGGHNIINMSLLLTSNGEHRSRHRSASLQYMEYGPQSATLRSLPKKDNSAYVIPMSA